jgi:hypothetical protein
MLASARSATYCRLLLKRQACSLELSPFVCGQQIDFENKCSSASQTGCSSCVEAIKASLLIVLPLLHRDDGANNNKEAQTIRLSNLPKVPTSDTKVPEKQDPSPVPLSVSGPGAVPPVHLPPTISLPISVSIAVSFPIPVSIAVSFPVPVSVMITLPIAA